MSDIIERIKKRIEDVQSKLDRSVFCDYDNAKYDGYECALIIIDEELVKEPHEEPNIPLECVDGSCHMALSEEYVERGMDVVHSCAECQYQPQVQPIVRCKDCIWFEPKHIKNNDGSITYVDENAPMVTTAVGINCQATCRRYHHIENLFVKDSGEAFCSYGEKEV